MAEPYSPLRYPGGKAKLGSFLIQVMHANGFKEPRYVEPYAGGAGAALRLLFEEYVESIIINDADPRLYCFWLSITKETDKFIKKIESTEISIAEWFRQRKIYSSCDCGNILQLGFATFYLNRTTRSGIIHNGGPIGGYSQNGNYLIDARFNRAKLIQRINRIGAYSDRISVSCKDGLVLLKEINRKYKKAKNTFVYIDPPYFDKGNELYFNTFTHDQHKQLSRYLSSEKNFPWILTYDNVENILKMYHDFNKFQFKLSYSAYKRKCGKELLIHPESITIPSEAKKSLPMAA